MPVKGRNEGIKNLRHFPVEGGERGTKMSKNAHVAAKKHLQQQIQISPAGDMSLVCVQMHYSIMAQCLSPARTGKEKADILYLLRL